MSLDELRAQAEAEEAKATEVEGTEAEELESEAEEPEDDDGADESDDIELELDGEPEPDQQKPTPEEAILHKLTKERKKRQQAKSENDELKAKIAALEARLNGQPVQPQRSEVPQVELPPFPDLYDEGINGDRAKFDHAIKQWWAKSRDAEQAVNQRSQSENQYRQQIEDKTRRLAERVGKFAVQHRMKDDYVVGAVQRATEEIDGAAGIDGAFAHLLDAVGEGSEKAAIYVGSKPDELERVKNLLAEDNTGLKAISYLTRIATRKPAQRKTSSAPEPDQPLRGDGSTASARKLQSQYDKESDPHKLLALRKKARELGVKLS